MHYQLLSVQHDIMTVPLSWVACWQLACVAVHNGLLSRLRLPTSVTQRNLVESCCTSSMTVGWSCQSGWVLACRPAPEWRQALSAIEQSPATRRQQHQTQQQPLPDSRASSKSGGSACWTGRLSISPNQASLPEPRML